MPLPCQTFWINRFRDNPRVTADYFGHRHFDSLDPLHLAGLVGGGLLFESNPRAG